MLTNVKIKAAKPKEKQYKLADSGGLFLLVKTNGGKYWRLKYRFAGKEKTLSIGVYPQVTLIAARKAREEAKEKLHNNIDPSEAKKLNNQKQQISAENSFKAVAMEWYSKRETTWAPATAKKHLSLLENDILPYIGRRPIAEIETYELVGCLNRIVERGAIETAHKSRQIVNQICRYAKQTGRIKHNPASDLQGALPPVKVSHMAAITEPAEFAKLLVDIDRYEGSNIIRTAIRLAPLLFQRPGELCSMEWSEIDLEKALWIIPREKKKERNKAEGDHIVPLCTQAIELLKDIMPLTGHGKYVFPNQRNYEKHMNPESLNKALKIMGYSTKEQHSTHGFRASARTMMDEQLQIKVEWIEQQLAHKVRDHLGNAYNRTKHLPQRIEMMQRWADYLDELKRQKLAGNVITANFG